MHVNDLPETILIRLFGWYCEPLYDPISIQWQFAVWKSRLELLKVCRVWRELALLVVHRESFITCIHKSSDTSGSDIDDFDSEDPNASRSNGSHTKKDLFKSNIDILDSIRIKNWPRILQVYVETTGAPLLVYQELVQKIQTNRHILNRVQSLRIEIFNYKFDMYDHTDMAKTSALGEDFCQLIPSVHYLNLNSTVYMHDAPDFHKFLVNGYAHKLKCIKCPQWILEGVSSFSSKLTHAEIYDLGDYMHMPNMCSDSLERLSLSNIHNDILWSSFENKSNPGILSFSNLNTLKLYAHIGIGENDEGDNEFTFPAQKFNYKIVAPKLEKVTMNLCPHTFSILSSITGLSVIKHVELDSGASEIAITGLNLDKARILFSRYATGSHEPFEPVDLFSYVNDIFSVDGLAERTRLLHCSHVGIPDGVQIEWKYLDVFDMYSPLKIMDLAPLLLKLPSLKYIWVGKLDLDTDDQSSAMILDPEATIDPIESMLKEILVTTGPLWTDVDVDNLKRYLGKLLPDSKVVTLI